MMDFTRTDLVSHFGSWVRVQVAFYDFLFEFVQGEQPENFNDQIREAVQEKGWADGNAIYENTITLIEKSFASTENAWLLFLDSIGHKEL